MTCAHDWRVNPVDCPECQRLEEQDPPPTLEHFHSWRLAP